MFCRKRTPTWVQTGYIIEYRLRKDYERAMTETMKHRPLIAFWDHAMVAAMLGKLGREDEASEHID